MKQFLVITLVCLLSASAFAQDEIYFKDGRKEEVRLVEITPNQVKYKKYDHEDGPSYSVEKRTILVLVYENGTYEYPNISESDLARSRQQALEKEGENEFGQFTQEAAAKAPSFKANFFSVNVLNFAHGNVNFAYERIFSSGKIGLRIPVKIGFDNNNIDSYIFPSLVNQKVVASGEVGVMYYPWGQRTATYVSGVGLEVGASNRFDFIEGYYTPTGSYVERYDIDEEVYSAVLFYNGMSISPAPRFGMTFLMGIGPRNYLNDFRSTEVMLNLSFNLGYRF